VPWDASSFAKHNHSLSPTQAGHAARIANKILERSGDEGMAIATANKMVHRGFGGHIPHYDDGGTVPQIGGVAPSAATANPNTQNLIQRFQAMSPEQLQETTLRLGPSSPLAGLAKQVLMQKRVMPQPGQQPQMGGVAPISPVQQAPMPQVPGGGGQQGFAGGGGIGFGQENPWWERREASSADSGFLHSAIPGRTDQIASSPAANSFVVPADVVSGLGEGNSLAGAHLIQMALGTGPHGIPLPRGGGGRGPPHPPSLGAMRSLENESRGGKTKKVDIMAAGGEFILKPEEVAAIGNGDVAKGHKRLEAWVVHQRQKIINEMKKLKGPVKS
jgi:hypothetical protein